MSQNKKKRNYIKRFFKKDSKTPYENTTEDIFEIESTPKHDFDEESSSESIFIIEQTPKEFKILGLDEDVTDKEIKDRYRYLIKKYHPDMGGDPKKFMKIKKAYEKIMECRSST